MSQYGNYAPTAVFSALILPSQPRGSPDDTVYRRGLIYLADIGANAVYRLTATGLTPGSVYVDVGDEP